MDSCKVVEAMSDDTATVERLVDEFGEVRFGHGLEGQLLMRHEALPARAALMSAIEQQARTIAEQAARLAKLLDDNRSMSATAENAAREVCRLARELEAMEDRCSALEEELAGYQE